MGIRFYCPNGHRLNVKEFQAGRKGICPYCGAKIQIPTQSTRPSSKAAEDARRANAWQPTGGAQPQDAPPAAAPTDDGGGTPPQPSPVVVSQEPAAAAPLESFPAAVLVPAQPQPAAPAATGVADPLAEAGDVVWYVRPPAGGQFGPAGSDVVHTWIEEGRVSGDSLVWREGWRDWQEAAEVFPQLGAGEPESPLEAITTGETSPATIARTRRARWRRRSKNTQIVVVILLIFAVIILSGVFLWVIWGQSALSH